MKKTIFSVLVILALVGCQEENSNDSLVLAGADFVGIVETFTDVTKTEMDNNTDILWSQGDQLAIFQGSTLADKYQVTDASVGKSNGIFEIVDNSGELNGDFSSGNEISTNIAVYPYMEGLSCAKANVKQTDTGTEVSAYKVEDFLLPTVQNYVPNSFGNGTFPMVAVTESMSDHSLKFKNVCGAIKLQLKGTDMVKSIKIEGRKNEKLSGTATIIVYPSDLSPVITMSDDATTSVTLDCGDGVQLNEHTATCFIISLPPLIFTQGFKVTVTTSTDETRTIETTSTNTILRSSVLVMPVVKIDDGQMTPEEGEDEELIIPISSIALNKTSMTLYVGITLPQTITMTQYTPSDATELSLTWSSNSPEVAIVDQSGCVTAVSEGIAKIYATSGSATATCTVTVIEIEVATAATEYIDEYGVNHGYGTVIGEQVWAPVNCGYHETDFPYGKLYQWGRKYGQGLGVPYDSGEIELAKGGVSLAGGQHTSNANKFYTGDNWLLEENGTLWNSGTNEYPKKNSYDPCPNGWRVPTYEELCTLAITHSDIVTLDRGLKGMYFSGPYNCSEIANRIFLPASGYRYYRDGGLYNVGNFGRYWSSTPFYTSLSSTSYNAYYLYFYSDGSVYSSSNTSRTHGCSVRCLQE